MSNTYSENQLVNTLSNYIINKSANRNKSKVDYKEIENETNIPSVIIRAATKQICKCIMDTRKIVDDVDYVDGEYFDVMIKRRTV